MSHQICDLFYGAYLLIRVIHSSSIVSLYEFAVSSKSSTWARSCYHTALEKLFDASKTVACVVEHMLSDIPVEAIPGTVYVSPPFPFTWSPLLRGI